ncbi:MAG: hypothetical protein ABIZ70_14485 [Gemmatimonadales bacterium]
MVRIFIGALALGALCAGRLSAQTDFRNLDDGRPIATEDAWPIEHRGFELLAPVAISRAAGRTESVVTPELGWGILRNAMIGGKLPVLLGSNGGIAGPRAYAFYNFNSESASLPGFALRADVAFPGGVAAGDRATVALKAIATRSWGRFRTHLNVVHGFGEGASLPATDAAPRWGASLASDLLSIRRSTLFLFEVRAAEPTAGDDLEWTAAGGLRSQLTPTLVFDVGVATSIARDGGSQRSFTLGLTHTFGLAALWPRGAQ